MDRATNAELDKLAERINEALEITEEREQYHIGHAYGQPRLERNNGSVNVSPRLSKGELRRWMWAYLDGIYVAQSVAEQRTKGGAA